MSSQEQPRTHEVYEQLAYQTGPTLARGEDCTICLEQIVADADALAHNDGRCLNAWHVACLEAELQASELRVGFARCPNCRAELSERPQPGRPQHVTQPMLPSTPRWPTVLTAYEPEAPLPRRWHILRAGNQVVRNPTQNINTQPTLTTNSNNNASEALQLDGVRDVDEDGYNADDDLPTEELIRNVGLNMIQSVVEIGDTADNDVNAALGEALGHALWSLRALDADWDMFDANFGNTLEMIGLEFYDLQARIVDQARALATQDEHSDFGPVPGQDLNTLWLDLIVAELREDHAWRDELLRNWDLYDHRLVKMWWVCLMIASNMGILTHHIPNFRQDFLDQLQDILMGADAAYQTNQEILSVRPELVDRASLQFLIPDSDLYTRRENWSEAMIYWSARSRLFDEIEMVMQTHLHASYANLGGIPQREVRAPVSQYEPVPEDLFWLYSMMEEQPRPERVIRLDNHWQQYNHDFVRVWYEAQVEADALTDDLQSTYVADDIEEILRFAMFRANAIDQANESLDTRADPDDELVPFNAASLRFMASNDIPDHLDQLIREYGQDTEIMMTRGHRRLILDMTHAENLDDLNTELQAHIEDLRRDLTEPDFDPYAD